MNKKSFALSAAPILAAMLALTNHASAQVTATPQSSSQSPEVDQFQKLEDGWSTAVANKDQYALENLLSPSFLDIAADGDISTRNQFVANMFAKGQPDLVSIEQRVVNVRIVEDVAIIDGTYIVKHKISGVVREERGIFTHTYQRTRSSWVCIHSQRTPVVEQGGPDQKPKTQKKSSAELPFHVPFFHKGDDSSQPPPPPGSNQPPS
ncbi:nuclear transport factor 2 family protein [Silvibacterium acidisoli]|uniref:nuclear transport factor 2 family protein n=1 Tax=Acidobacteriaceae bacterium ZG23-2 TaxID=2883246 RepID=UPI00406D3D72